MRRRGARFLSPLVDTLDKQLWTHHVREPAQLEALTSPARIEIVVCLESTGPATVRQLAERLGRKPSSLYYHVELLERVGLLTSVETRRPDGRAEAQFQLIANRITLQIDASEPGMLQHATQATSATLRLASREASRAYERGWNTKGHGMYAVRLKVKLDEEDHAQMVKHLREIEELVRRRSISPAESGRVYSWTTMLVPVAEPDVAAPGEGSATGEGVPAGSRFLPSGD